MLGLEFFMPAHYVRLEDEHEIKRYAREWRRLIETIFSKEPPLIGIIQRNNPNYHEAFSKVSREQIHAKKFILSFTASYEKIVKKRLKKVIKSKGRTKITYWTFTKRGVKDIHKLLTQFNREFRNCITVDERIIILMAQGILPKD